MISWDQWPGRLSDREKGPQSWEALEQGFVYFGGKSQRASWRKRQLSQDDFSVAIWATCFRNLNGVARIFSLGDFDSHLPGHFNYFETG